jgi:hypothetical protein
MTKPGSGRRGKDKQRGTLRDERNGAYVRFTQIGAMRPSRLTLGEKPPACLHTALAIRYAASQSRARFQAAARSRRSAKLPPRRRSA